jgi:hypothetical protein
MSKPKNHGKYKARVFLDIFSLSENESGVHFPVKNLDQQLENLSCFAVRHCSTRLEKRKGVVSSSVTVCTRLSTSFKAEDDVVII